MRGRDRQTGELLSYVSPEALAPPMTNANESLAYCDVAIIDLAMHRRVARPRSASSPHKE